MKYLIILFLLLIAAAFAIDTVNAENTGYVLFRFAGWRLEMTALLFVVGLIVVLLSGYLLLRLIGGAIRLPSRVANNLRQRGQSRAQQEFMSGYLELREGRPEIAERRLVKHAQRSETPLLHYLAAAQAADMQNAPTRRDDWLQKARDISPESEQQINLAQAELYVQQRDYAEAQALLLKVKEQSPNHSRMLGLLAACYKGTANHTALIDLLPVLDKKSILPEPTRNQFWIELLEVRLLTASGPELNALWEQMPKRLRSNADITTSFVKRELALASAGDAATRIRKYLRQQWNTELACLYATIDTGDLQNDLGVVEGWVKTHPKDGLLLLAAARICRKAKLWGKARAHLEASLEYKASADAWHELGLLEEQQGNSAAALKAYRQALLVAGGHSDQRVIAAELLEPEAQATAVNS